MENLALPALLGGAVLAIRPLRRRVIAVGKASARAGLVVGTAAVSGTIAVVKAGIVGEERPQAA